MGGGSLPSGTVPYRAADSAASAPPKISIPLARSKASSTKARQRVAYPGAPRLASAQPTARSTWVPSGSSPPMRLLRLADPLDADLDRGHLAADLVVDLRGDLGIRLEEVAGVLPALS